MGASRPVNAVLCSTRARGFSQHGSRDSSTKPVICASSIRPRRVAWHVKPRRNSETKIRVLETTDGGGGASAGVTESFLDDDRATGAFAAEAGDGIHRESFVSGALELLGFALSQPGHHRLDGGGMAASELIASAEEAIRAAGSLDSSAPLRSSLDSPTNCSDEPPPLKPIKSSQTGPVEALLEEEKEERRDELAVIRQILEARELEESERLEIAGLLQRLEETALEMRRQRRAPGGSLSSSSGSSSISPAWQRKSGVSQESLAGRLKAAAAAATVVSSSDGPSQPLRAAEAWKAVLQGSSPRGPPAAQPQQQQQQERKPEPAWVRRLEAEDEGAGVPRGEGRAPLEAPAASPWATSSRAARHRATPPPAADGLETGEQLNGPQS